MPWYTSASGSRLWYEDHGIGTPVVFIHGWCMSSAVWELQREGLSDSCRVIVLNLPGHGTSSVPAGGFSIKGCAADIAGLFEALGLQNALLAGWSLGSLIALETFPLLRARLSGMVLIAGTPRFTQSGDYRYGLSQIETEGMARKVQRSLRRALEGFTGLMFAPGELDEPQQAVRIQNLLSNVSLPLTTIALQALQALVEADLRDQLALIDLPTLIMNGDCDVICLPQASEFLAKRIPLARQVLFTGCGHAPFLTQSCYFNACLEEFRSEVSVVH
ncbi:MAG: alpha/beta fold hydrolase [Desulfuromonadales bacterium]|nr:alpha/beta fold hydrolase [Desulfuromonadales bacterium]